MKTLSYKGFTGSIDISFPDNCLYGKVEFITDLVTFEGKNIPEIKKAFKEAVDDYLAVCKQLEQVPEKQFKGSFNIRIGAELHKQAAIYAKNHGMSLNEFVGEAVKKSLQNRQHNEIHIHHHGQVDFKSFSEQYKISTIQGTADKSVVDSIRIPANTIDNDAPSPIAATIGGSESLIIH